MIADKLWKVAKWLTTPISDDSYAGTASQVLPVQPLEGMFFKAEQMKFRNGKTIYLLGFFFREAQ